MKKKTTIVWHSANELPAKTGYYLVLTDESIFFDGVLGTRPTTCLSLEFNAEFKKWNVTVVDGEVINPHDEITSVKWWASVDDIEEV